MSTHIQQKCDKFEHQIETVCEEIKNKFDSLRYQLDKSEEEILSCVRKTQSDAMSQFDKSFSELTCICTIQDAVNSSTDASTCQSDFIDAQREEYTAKIDGILRNAGIENTIRLKWKIHSLSSENICEVIGQKHSTIEPLTGDISYSQTHRDHDSFRENIPVRRFQNRRISDDIFGVTNPFGNLSMSSDTTQNNRFLTSSNIGFSWNKDST